MYTQEELEAKSDFEINKLVAEKEGIIADDDCGRPDSVGSVFCYEMFSSVGEPPCPVLVKVNYCRSWDNMGAIIGRERIMVLFDPLTKKWFAASEFNEWMNQCPSFSDNPLRAAAIVYLLME